MATLIVQDAFSYFGGSPCNVTMMHPYVYIWLANEHLQQSLWHHTAQNLSHLYHIFGFHLLVYYSGKRKKTFELYSFEKALSLPLYIINWQLLALILYSRIQCFDIYVNKVWQQHLRNTVCSPSPSLSQVLSIFTACFGCELCLIVLMLCTWNFLLLWLSGATVWLQNFIIKIKH